MQRPIHILQCVREQFRRNNVPVFSSLDTKDMFNSPALSFDSHIRVFVKISIQLGFIAGRLWYRYRDCKIDFIESKAFL